MSFVPGLVLITIIGYLWGSLPSGYWMGMLLRGRHFDIRNYGSHKMGATNVRRVLGNIPAAIVFVLDLSKGIGPALLAIFIPFFHGMGWGITAAGLAALLGHIFPVFIGFKGGRGVSTSGGTLLVASPLAFAISLLTSAITIALSRYVSLGSIVGALTGMTCAFIFYFVGRVHPTFIGRIGLPEMLFIVIAAALVILFHHDNIARLLAGTESKLGQETGLERAPSNVKA